MARKTRRSDPRLFRAVGNVAGRGVKGVENIVEYGAKGVWGLGKGLVKGTGKVLSLGTGAANKVIGATGRVLTGKRRTKKRKSRR